MLRSRLLRVLTITAVWTLVGGLAAIYDDLAHRTVGFSSAGYEPARAFAFKMLVSAGVTRYSVTGKVVSAGVDLQPWFFNR